MQNNFVFDSTEFADLKNRASKIFRLGQSGLPNQVFLDQFTKFRFVEFDVMLFKEFWTAIVKCVEICGDQDISIIVHNPDPEKYYNKNFNFYGALRFDRKSSSEEYKQAFLLAPEGSPVDALQYVATVLSWCGSSEKWGFWGDRDLGIGVVACCHPNFDWPIVEGIEWLDIDKAILNCISSNFKDEAIPNDFLTSLKKNYEIGSK